MNLDYAPPERFETAIDELHNLVAAETGSADFGDDSYRPGLQALLQSMDYDPHFSERGRRIAWGHVVDALIARAIAIRSMKEHPGFDRTPVPRPVIITGIPRTGTTALHKLMAVDRRFQGLEKWLLGAPVPRPPRAAWPDHPYFRREVDRMATHFGTAPDHRAAHYMTAEEVEECIWIERSVFLSTYWPCHWSAATYDAWLQGQDVTPVYDQIRRTLQLVGLNDPDRRWLLKNPSHILHLDRLFATFPDALVIQTHRDPAKAVPSLCALLMQLHAVMEVGRADLRARTMLAREVSKWASGVRDAEPVRQTRRDQVLDVVHGDFHRDPIGTIRRIYAFIGMDLPPAVEAAMAERVAADPERSHGAHRYDLADFGMPEGEIHDRFGDYVGRFDLGASS